MTISERSGPSGPPRLLKKWTPLLLGVAAIVVFVIWLAPAIGNIPSISAAVTVLREGDMEAGAYFYTDVEQVRESELFVRHTFQFSQRREE